MLTSSFRRVAVGQRTTSRRAAILSTAAASLAGAGLLAACSGKSGTDAITGTGTKPPVNTVSIAVDTVRLTAGGTAQVVVRALDASGQVIPDAAISYSVGNGAVAAVTAGGMLSGQHLGATKLHVMADGASADVPVIVRFDSLSFVRRVLSGGPYGVGVAGDAVVVTQKDAGTVAVGSLSGGPIVGGVAVGSIPTDVSVNAAGTEAYVTNQYSNTLGIVNVTSRTQVATVRLPYSPYRSVLTRDGSRVWVTTNTGPIYAVDVASRTVVDSLPGVGPTNGFAIAPGDTLAYASNYAGQVREFDLRTKAVRRTLTAQGVLQEVVVSGDGKELYVGNENGFVEVFDLTTGTNVQHLALGQVFGMALGPDGNTLFVAQSLNGVVAAVDRGTRKILFQVPTGGTPRRAKFNANGTMIVVANEAGWVDFLR